MLRAHLKDELQAGLHGLKRTSTKEWDGKCSQEDIEFFAKMYHQHDGDSPKLAEVCGLSIEVLRERPPRSAQDFAENLVRGSYDAVDEAMAAKRLRLGLAELGRGGLPKLRRTETKTGDGLPEVEAVAAVAPAYDRCGGDLEAVAQFFSASLDLLRRNSPEDGKDFATKLLSGCYTDTTADEVRRRLRETLTGNAIKLSASHLRRTHTKECCMGPGGSSKQDVAAMEQLFAQHSGDLDKLAAVTGTNVQRLKANPPKDGTDFAVRILMGLYTEA